MEGVMEGVVECAMMGSGKRSRVGAAVAGHRHRDVSGGLQDRTGLPPWA